MLFIDASSIYQLWQKEIIVAVFIAILFRFFARKLFVKTILTSWLFYLPGTILHELAHFVVAILTFAAPRRFNLIPKREGNVYVLGSVQCARANLLNAAFVGLAPVLLLFPALYFWQNFFDVFYEKEYIKAIALAWVAYTTTASAMPSSQDIRFAMPSLFFYAIVSILIYSLS